MLNKYCQTEDDGFDYPNAYASINLNKHERNYLTINREDLDTIFGLQNYRNYLLANPLIFYTDN